MDRAGTVKAFYKSGKVPCDCGPFTLASFTLLLKINKMQGEGSGIKQSLNTFRNFS